MKEGRKPEYPEKTPGNELLLSRTNHASELNIGTPVAALPGAWLHKVSLGTG